ncbi:hypothetical protein D918_08842 [Trichuris suis]|nr:hypothetical protein D918_08842 [Trichuris suis]
MAWSNVQKQDVLLVARQNFCPTSTGPYLTLLLGDVVRAVKCCGGMYCLLWGTLKLIYTSALYRSEVTSVAKTAVEAVSSIVTEWRKICQTDYEVRDLLAEERAIQGLLIYQRFYLFQQSGTLDIQTVFGMMKEIINWRSQITSLKLSLEEVKKLNYKIALKVDVGNRSCRPGHIW